MTVEHRISLLKKLGEYILSDDEQWKIARERAHYENGWFIPEFIDFQLRHIAHEYLLEEKLKSWRNQYPPTQGKEKTVGIIMAGNIPLAGIHDFIAAFLAGHTVMMKPSSKDQVLITVLVNKLKSWDPSLPLHFAQQLKNCDAYIATGSNNSARYFDYYFSKYPHIIRHNRTSAAILTGRESMEELSSLADDVHLYFGLGCRNITKLMVPENYDFIPLLEAFKKYHWIADNHKYKNNYDYQLAIMIINKVFYMTNGSILLQQNGSVFSPISVLHYEYYQDEQEAGKAFQDNESIQCVVGEGFLPFGTAQQPSLTDYADNTDTLRFLLEL